MAGQFNCDDCGSLVDMFNGCEHYPEDDWCKTDADSVQVERVVSRQDRWSVEDIKAWRNDGAVLPDAMMIKQQTIIIDWLLERIDENQK